MPKSDLKILEAAIKLSMKKEKFSYDFYNEQAKATNVAIAKIFYNRLKAEGF